MFSFTTLHQFFIKHFNAFLLSSTNFVNKVGFNRHVVWYYYCLHVYYIVGFKLFIPFIGVTPVFFSKYHLPVIPALVDVLVFDVLPEINPNFWFCRYRDNFDLDFVVLHSLSIDLNAFSLITFKYFFIYFS